MKEEFPKDGYCLIDKDEDFDKVLDYLKETRKNKKASVNQKTGIAVAWNEKFYWWVAGKSTKPELSLEYLLNCIEDE